MRNSDKSISLLNAHSRQNSLRIQLLAVENLLKTENISCRSDQPEKGVKVIPHFCVRILAGNNLYRLSTSLNRGRVIHFRAQRPQLIYLNRTNGLCRWRSKR
ncbi:hypothetical protein C0557_12615 [Kosakonia sp. MUSA4]|nr:hypothetical protein C0557_12615 [Kosakonia sp. MUSA4]